MELKKREKGETDINLNKSAAMQLISGNPSLSQSEPERLAKRMLSIDEEIVKQMLSDPILKEIWKWINKKEKNLIIKV